MNGSIVRLVVVQPQNCATCCRWGLDALYRPYCYEWRAALPTPLIEHRCARYQQEVVDSDAVETFEALLGSVSGETEIPPPPPSPVAERQGRETASTPDPHPDPLPCSSLRSECFARERERGTDAG